ncbi:MAG: hypothetical protein mread185_000165 [Mycoplasmataceae bacterium]|nr:MAG: hypothetical protein mread185_000165 [Mycoplasmataceae bacterium]
MFCCLEEPTKEFGVTRVDFCFTRVIASSTRLGKYQKSYAYFDIATGKKITEAEANRNKSKNRTSEDLYREALQLQQQGQNELARQRLDNALQECTDVYENREIFKQRRDQILEQQRLEREGNSFIEEGANLLSEAVSLLEQGRRTQSLTKYQEAEQRFQLALSSFEQGSRVSGKFSVRC